MKPVFVELVKNEFPLPEGSFKISDYIKLKYYIYDTEISLSFRGSHFNAKNIDSLIEFLTAAKEQLK